MSQHPATPRNHTGDDGTYSTAEDAEALPPPWGPREMLALRERLATDDEPWDLLVVGAGITGAGIARDAALRGLRVVVVEASDIAFGTSSRSTRLIHGGVRYLEQGDVALVFEALRERQRLYRTAPHLVRSARFLFPAYVGDRLGPWKLRLGLSFYDLLDLYRSRPHDFLGPAAALTREPMLREEGLLGAVLYDDAITDDARLTLTVLQDARRHGCEILTYARCETLERAGDHHCAVLADGTRISAHACVVAAGPWTGPRLLGRQGKGLLALSKGIHVVMRSSDVPVHQPVVIQVPGERRILFVVPWGTRTYLGTTDTPYYGEPGQSGVASVEEREVLEIVGRVLPGAALHPDHIVSAWSGVRPLVRPEHGRSAIRTEEVSRRHRLVRNENGVLGIVGGKLTTYRAMAEEIVDEVVAGLRSRWPPGRRPPVRCQTDRRPLIAGKALTPEELADPVIADLAARHGPNARILAGMAAREPGLAARMIGDLPYRWVEVDHAIRHEGCVHLDDVLRRRLPLALTDSALGATVAPTVAERLADACGGGGPMIREELERYREIVFRETRRAPNLR